SRSELLPTEGSDREVGATVYRSQDLDKPLHGAGVNAAVAQDEAGGALDDLAGQGAGDEGAIADFAADRDLRDEGEASAVLDDALDRLDVVELADDPDGDPMSGEQGVGGAAGGDIAVEGDERLAAQTLPRDLFQCRERVVRGEDTDHALPRKRHDLDIAVRFRVGDDAQVDTAGAQHLDRS